MEGKKAAPDVEVPRGPVAGMEGRGSPSSPGGGGGRREGGGEGGEGVGFGGGRGAGRRSGEGGWARRRSWQKMATPQPSPPSPTTPTAPFCFVFSSAALLPYFKTLDRAVTHQLRFLDPHK